MQWNDAIVVDALELKCPEPVMLLHAAIRKAPDGAHLLLLATDPSTERDVASFCRFLNHKLVDVKHGDGQFNYLIRKLPK